MLKHKFILLLGLASLLLSPFVIAAGDKPTEGVHYLKITPAQPTSVPEGKIEVVELFWYGCPHCYRFEPYLKAWLKNKPDDIVFRRVPAVMRESWEIHARVYFAAEVLDLVDRIHEPFFNEIHASSDGKGRQRLSGKEGILDFIGELGIDTKKFEQAMYSFSVSGKIRQAKKLVADSGASGVPSLIINGKYLTDSGTAGNYNNMIYLANYLSAQESGPAEKPR